MDTISIILVFIAATFGSLSLSFLPWLRSKIAAEQALRLLDMKDPAELTEEEKRELKLYTAPLNFQRYYLFTTIGSVVFATLTITTSFNSILESVSSYADVGAAMYIAFLAGSGTAGLASQIIKSADSPIVKAAQAITVQKGLQTIVDRKSGSHNNDHNSTAATPI